METLTTAGIWQKSKLLIKGVIITVLVLLLMIPAYFVENLIREREQRHGEAVAEVSSKWAGAQTITGPVLVVPFREPVVNADNKTSLRKGFAYLLPEQLDVDASMAPEKRYRGIYEVTLYTSDVQLNGRFSPASFLSLNVPRENFLWNEAYLCMHVSDARGLREEMNIRWNGTDLPLHPAVVSNGVMEEGFASQPLTLLPDSSISFSMHMGLNGSERLLCSPTGKETNVVMRSSWPDPSFTGSRLPINASVSDSGFEARWTSLAHTRNFPQVWKDTRVHPDEAAFGTDLFIPVNAYQKALRSVKYAVLVILLTFTAFFLIETTHKKSVHPVQYALIGFALILFYTLLLSFSEYVGFNGAYAAAGVATVALITWFVRGLLGTSRLSALLMTVLVLLYAYIFTILQLQDYALLMGSVGLFLTLAIVMRFSRSMQW